MRTKKPEQPLSPHSKPPITPQEKIALVFEDLEERASCVEGLGRQIAGNIEELKTVLKEAGHVVPIVSDRKIHLTLEQAEKL